jgi:hypothetical protein
MSWTCTGFQGASQFRQQLMRAPTPHAALDLLDQQMRQLE